MLPSCRICRSPLDKTFVDLGVSPPCEDILTVDRLDVGETFYPLNVRICRDCLLVQLPAYIPADAIFTDTYAYYSSFSTSWVEHARKYTVAMVERLDLGPSHFVMEVASNDGYLLRHFKDLGIPVLGIEPAGNVADAAIKMGIETRKVFLGVESAREIVEEYGRADLVAGNNVFAHVPDLHDFVGGLSTILAPTGTLTLEFPHLQRLIEQNQYDTIYHEHFSYYTLRTAQTALALGGLVVVDVEQLPTHGGSLRLFVEHAELGTAPTEAVTRLLAEEEAAGLHTLAGHEGFASKVDGVKFDLLTFLIEANRAGKVVAGYGAPGKGNTLLNHCGIRSDLLKFTVDMNPNKHGLFLPGSHIPVHAPDMLEHERPDYIVILPWNLRREIEQQLEYTREWGAKLVVAIPKLEVW